MVQQQALLLFINMRCEQICWFILFSSTRAAMAAIRQNQDFGAPPLLMRITRWPQWLRLALLALLALSVNLCRSEEKEQLAKLFFQKAESASGHTNNWAVLVCSSRYWFNYRVSCGVGTLEIAG